MTVSNRRRTAVAGAGAACLALALAACGSSSGSGSSPSATTASAPAPATTAPSPGSTGSTAPAGVRTARSAALGTIVVDGKGFTLYRYDKDSAAPSASHCTGGCATLWPPAPASAAGSATGIAHGLLGTVTRTDGSEQLTLHGWPLYTYSPDSAPGATGGQGVGGLWWAATPTGGKAAAPPSAPPATSAPATTGSTSGGAYGY